MKAKVKSGHKHLFIKGASCNWNDIKDVMIVNFTYKGTYIGFKQKKNHLLINTTEGEIDIVFTGEVPKLEFDHYCKDQVIFYVNKYDAASDGVNDGVNDAVN